MVVEDGEWIDNDALPAEREHTDAIHEAYPEWARDTVKLEPQPAEAFEIPAPEGASEVSAEVVRVHENQVVTSRESATLPVEDGTVALDGDVSKAAVLERHGGDESIGRGFVTGFGFERGAVASTVAHDSHNLLVVGTSDEAMARAAERTIELDGGMVAVDDDGVLAEVPLPIAGLMSDLPLSEVSERVHALEGGWEELGCDLDSPFMTMSLLALAVLPEIRITNRGVVDTVGFDFIEPVGAD
jgi:adenine deaminase